MTETSTTVALRPFFPPEVFRRLAERFGDRLSPHVATALEIGDEGPLRRAAFALYNAARPLDRPPPAVEAAVRTFHGERRTYEYRANGDILFICVPRSADKLTVIDVVGLDRSAEHLKRAAVTRLQPRLTKHALERLHERFRRRFSKGALTALRNGNGEPFVAEALALFEVAEENRSFLNNTRFMAFIAERYGHEQRHAFRVNGDVIFVCIENHVAGELLALTALELGGSEFYSVNTFGQRQKFRSN